jgi:hypothetical protein
MVFLRKTTCFWVEALVYFSYLYGFRDDMEWQPTLTARGQFHSEKDRQAWDFIELRPFTDLVERKRGGP